MNTPKLNHRPGDLLLAARNVIYATKDHIEELEALRSFINRDYVSELEQKINNAIKSNLGIEENHAPVLWVRQINSIRIPALRDISFLKTQIEQDFKKDKEYKKILDKLGITDHLRNSVNGNRQSFIELMYSITRELKGKTKTKIVNKGTPEELINRIVNYTSGLDLGSMRKKSKKKLSPNTMSIANKKEVEDIITEVNNICKIASNFFQYDPLIKQRFIIDIIVKNLSTTRKLVMT